MATTNSTEKIYRRHYPTRAAAFSDNRVFLVKPGDRRMAGISGAPVFVEQEAHGPVYIAIAAGASDLALESIHAQYEVPLEDLLQFRAEREVELAALA